MSGESTGLWARPGVARAYRETRGLATDTRAEWGRALRAAIPERGLTRLVDVGCGTARFAELVTEIFGGVVVGIDAAPAMLAERDPVPSDRAVFLAGTAEHLPLRSGCADLVLFSMVYHLIGDRAAAIAEARRVLRAGGWAVLRTPTREIVHEVDFLRFFPGSVAIDEARMPPRADVEAAFSRAGLTRHAHMTVWQTFAESPAAAYAKVSQRAFSNLQMISDEAFKEGLAAYEAHCRSAPDAPVRDRLDLFVFRAEGRTIPGSG